MSHDHARPVRMEIYRTAIPMRRFEHAAASRSTAEAVVVRIEWSDGTSGWGETLPRDYVTGETLDSVVADLATLLWPALVDQAPLREDGGSGVPVGRPMSDRSPDGRCILAAGAAMDLAVHDRAWREAGVAWRGRPLATKVGVTGVLGSTDPARTAKRLKLMRAFGLRAFKLKLGLGEDADAENLRVVAERIGKLIRAGRCTLRVDANGAWDADSAPRRIAALAAHGVSAVEQPVNCSARELAELARRCDLPLIADESLLTDADATALLAQPRKVWWNLRLSKNGGLVRTWHLAERARQAGVTYGLGCMVGESGILSAAQRRFCQAFAREAGELAFLEGNYGRWLLADDLTRPSPRFGYAGRLRGLSGAGLGVEVVSRKFERYARRVRSVEA